MTAWGIPRKSKPKIKTTHSRDKQKGLNGRRLGRAEETTKRRKTAEKNRQRRRGRREDKETSPRRQIRKWKDHDEVKEVQRREASEETRARPGSGALIIRGLVQPHTQQERRAETKKRKKVKMRKMERPAWSQPGTRSGAQLRDRRRNSGTSRSTRSRAGATTHARVGRGTRGPGASAWVPPAPTTPRDPVVPPQKEELWTSGGIGPARNVVTAPARGAARGRPGTSLLVPPAPTSQSHPKDDGGSSNQQQHRERGTPRRQGGRDPVLSVWYV